MKLQKQILSLRKDGFCVFKSAFTKNYLDQLFSIIEKLEYHQQMAVRGKSTTSSKVIQDLQSKNKVFLQLLKNKIITKVSKEILNDKFYRGVKKNGPDNL